SDLYGIDETEKPEPKRFTEDEVNERINRAAGERYERFERNSQGAAPKPDNQEAAQGEEQCQEQLTTCVESTVSNLSVKQQGEEAQLREQQARAEFEQKIISGRQRFKDYDAVVTGAPVSQPMLEASRGLDDPAAFWYTAQKRAPDDVKAISQMENAYAQMIAIGKLDDKLRAQKKITSTPKPIQKVTGGVSGKDSRELTIEEQIERSNKERLANLRRR